MTIKHEKTGTTLPDREVAVSAIRASWSRDTSANPDEWTPQNPSRGQCDASSFVFWELFGGDLVLAKVFVDDVQTEHHYWNRIDGEDIDLTGEQFQAGEDIREPSVVPDAYLRENAPTMREELRHRIDLLRDAVNTKIAAESIW